MYIPKFWKNKMIKTLYTYCLACANSAQLKHDVGIWYLM